MNRIVMLQKLEDGTIYCRRVESEYNTNISECGESPYWEEGGTIVLDELEEILDHE